MNSTLKNALAILALLAGACWLIGYWAPATIGVDRALAEAAGGRTLVDTDGNRREYGYGLIRFNGYGPEWHRWQRIVDKRELETKLDTAQAENRRLRRELRRKYEPSFEEYFDVAAAAYGVDRAMLERKGRCESRGFTDFYNETPIYNGEHAQGVMGFIPSTFRSTPFAEFDVRNDHLANIMAGAWMHNVGRGDEWACR